MWFLNQPTCSCKCIYSPGRFSSYSNYTTCPVSGEQFDPISLSHVYVFLKTWSSFMNYELTSTLLVVFCCWIRTSLDHAPTTNKLLFFVTGSKPPPQRGIVWLFWSARDSDSCVPVNAQMNNTMGKHIQDTQRVWVAVECVKKFSSIWFMNVYFVPTRCVLPVRGRGECGDEWKWNTLPSSHFSLSSSFLMQTLGYGTTFSFIYLFFDAGSFL